MIQGRLYLVKWLKKQQWPNIISRVAIENKLCQLELIQVLPKTRNHSASHTLRKQYGSSLTR